MDTQLVASLIVYGLAGIVVIGILSIWLWAKTKQHEDREHQRHAHG